jgi:hypothetical protein
MNKRDETTRDDRVQLRLEADWKTIVGNQLSDSCIERHWVVESRLAVAM